MKFSHDEAFCRRLSLLSETEQQRLRQTCIALPGMSGVGGGHLQMLARLGVGAFHLANLDTFEFANLNRQLGANPTTASRPRVDVLAEVAQGINPECNVQTFPDCILPETIDAFLDGVNAVVDGIEFSAIETRRMLYAACRRRRIPVVHAAPIGFGATLSVFTPDGMAFDDYFGIDDAMTRAEMMLAYSSGMAPDVDPKSVDIVARREPAVASACLLCSALAGMEVLKLVCGRGRLAESPHGIYFDPYCGRAVPLRPCPSLMHSLRGRLLRWLVARPV